MAKVLRYVAVTLMALFGLFGGSSDVVVMPIMVVGLLFLLAGSLGHEPLRSVSAHASLPSSH